VAASDDNELASLTFGDGPQGGGSGSRMRFASTAVMVREIGRSTRRISAFAWCCRI
jgi:hypothetical protein